MSLTLIAAISRLVRMFLIIILLAAFRMLLLWRLVVIFLAAFGTILLRMVLLRSVSTNVMTPDVSLTCSAAVGRPIGTFLVVIPLAAFGMTVCWLVIVILIAAWRFFLLRMGFLRSWTISTDGVTSDPSLTFTASWRNISVVAGLGTLGFLGLSARFTVRFPSLGFATIIFRGLVLSTVLGSIATNITTAGRCMAGVTSGRLGRVILPITLLLGRTGMVWLLLTVARLSLLRLGMRLGIGARIGFLVVPLFWLGVAFFPWCMILFGFLPILLMLLMVLAITAAMTAFLRGRLRHTRRKKVEYLRSVLRSRSVIRSSHRRSSHRNTFSFGLSTFLVSFGIGLPNVEVVSF